eukprot:1141358-Pelagomonas_calceolata.AAC.11
MQRPPRPHTEGQVPPPFLSQTPSPPLSKQPTLPQKPGLLSLRSSTPEAWSAEWMEQHPNPEFRDLLLTLVDAGYCWPGGQE